MNKITCLLLVLASLGCKSIISVNRSIVGDDSLSKYEVYGYYYLPKTILKLQIPIVVESGVKEGLLHKSDDACLETYLQETFGWKKAEKSKVIFSIGEKFLFNPITLPDNNKSYAILFKKDKSVGQTINVNFSKDGLIQSGEFAQSSNTFEVVTKSLEITASLIGTFAGLSMEQAIAYQSESCSFDLIKSIRARNLIKDAERLINIRFGLLSSPTNSVSTSAVVKYHIEEIDKQIKAVKEELVGSRTQKIHYLTYILDPDPNTELKDIPLLEIHDSLGVRCLYSDCQNLSEDITSPESTNQVETKILKLQVKKLYEQGLIRNPIAEFKTTSTATTTSKNFDTNVFLYYNLPEKYELKLVYDGKPITTYKDSKAEDGTISYEIYFPQLGKVSYLPIDFKDANITYYEDIGALKSAKLVREAEVTADRINQFYTAADSLRKVFNAISENSESSDDANEQVEEEISEQVIRLIIQESNDESEN